MHKILLTIVAVLAIVFALQNNTPVTLTLVVWQTDALHAVAVLGALIVGLLVGAISMLPALWHARRIARGVHHDTQAITHPAPPRARVRQADQAAHPEGID